MVEGKELSVTMITTSNKPKARSTFFKSFGRFVVYFGENIYNKYCQDFSGVFERY